MPLLKINDIASRADVSRAVVSAVINDTEHSGKTERAELKVLSCTIEMLQDKTAEYCNRYYDQKEFRTFDSICEISDNVAFSDHVQPVEESETEYEQLYVEGPQAHFIVEADDILQDTAIVTEQILKGKIQFVQSKKELTLDQLKSVIDQLQSIYNQASEIKTDGFDNYLELIHARKFLSPNAIDKFSKINYSL